MLIAPSVLPADFSRLGDELAALEVAGADLIQWDIMDGQFVPNLTVGPDVVASCRTATSLPFEAHLMVNTPEVLAKRWVEAGCFRLIVHAEACPHLHRTLGFIRELGVEAGVALNPATPFSAIEQVLDLVDLVLVMTVNPGFGGQKYLASMEPKIRQATAAIAATGRSYRSRGRRWHHHHDHRGRGLRRSPPVRRRVGVIPRSRWTRARRRGAAEPGRTLRGRTRRGRTPVPARRIELVTVGYGQPALDALAKAVASAQVGHVLDPVTVIVPNDAVGVAARRFLAKRGAAAVTFTTVRRLAEQLGANEMARSERRPLHPALVLAALRRQLRDDAGVFRPVAEHPATDEALLAADRELAGVRPDELSRLGALGGLTADLVRLHRATRRRLHREWYDETDLIGAARSVLATAEGDALGTLVVLLPQAMPARWREFLGALVDHRPTVVIAGVTDAGIADEEIRVVLRSLGLDLGGLAFVVAPSVALHTATDPDDEVRVALRLLTEQLESGRLLARCALVYPADKPYLRLLADQLDAAGITWNGPAPGRLAETVVGRATTQLLGLAAAAPTIRRGDLIGFVSAAPIRHRHQHAPVAAWERTLRAAGLHEGDAEHYRQRLGAHLDREELRLGTTLDAARATADDLGDFVGGLSADLVRLRAATTWQQAVHRLQTLLASTLQPDRFRSSWPLHEQQAVDALDIALQALGSLDSVDPKPDLGRFTRAVRQVLDGTAPRRGRLGDGLLVGPLSAVLGQHLDTVIVVGAAEGLLPSIPNDDALLSDRARRLAHLPTTDDRIARQRREFLAAIASGDQVIICRPCGDLRQTVARQPSRWLADLSSTVTDHPSFAAGITSAKRPATVQEFRVRELRVGQDPPTTDVAHHRAVNMLRSRDLPELTAFDGNVAEVVDLLPSPVAVPVAPTRLEAWVKCPHQYFMVHVLGAREIDDPGEQLWLSPLDQGNVVHEVLERFVAGAVAQDRRPDLDTETDQAALAEAARVALDSMEALGRSGRAVYWQHDRSAIANEIATFLLADIADLVERGAQPVATELRFGSGGQPPAEFVLSDGRVVGFRGFIDRVDRTRFNQLIVTDYKTGSPAPYRDIKPDNPHANGRFLQLPVYAAAARAAFPDANPDNVEVRYAFTRDQSRVSIQLDAVTQAAVVKAIETIVDGIGNGLFPHRPDPTPGRPGFVPCVYCDPDGLGVTDLHRAWRAKRDTDGLRPFLVLLGEEADDPNDSADDAG